MLILQRYQVYLLAIFRIILTAFIAVTLTLIFLIFSLQRNAVNYIIINLAAKKYYTSLDALPA